MRLVVINRQGEEEEFDLSKIRAAISKGVRDIKVNSLELESAFTGSLTEITHTSDIQQKLILAALALANVEEPEWSNVAGNLLVNDYTSNIGKNRLTGNPYSFSQEYVLGRVAKKIYDPSILKSYTPEDLKYIFTYILDPNRDFSYDFAGAELLITRYLIPGELIQEAYLTMALVLAANFGAEDNKIAKVQEFYDALSLKQISLATPLLANLRKLNPNLSSCFITSIKDDLKSIFQEVTNAAMISKEGGGIGACFSAVRAKGSSVNGRKGASNGVVPWIKIFNDCALAVNQG